MISAGNVSSWLANPTTAQIIVTGGGYASVAGARLDADNFVDAGFWNVVVLQRNGDIRTALVAWRSDQRAHAALPDVQRVLRPSAYMRDFGTWCPNHFVRDNVVTCGS